MLGAPPYSGFLKDLSKFDDKFFGLSSKHVSVMSPESRMLLELTFEAIVDAGKFLLVMEENNKWEFSNNYFLI